MFNWDSEFENFMKPYRVLVEKIKNHNKFNLARQLEVALLFDLVFSYMSYERCNQILMNAFKLQKTVT